MTARRAIVTGAARGIGRAVVERLVRDGYDVLAADIDMAEVKRTAGEIGDRCAAVQVDVTDADAVASLVGLAREGGGLDVFVSNAGIMPAGPLTTMPAGMTRAIFEVNALGTVHGYQAALPLFQQQGRGHFVTIASATGVKPLAGLAAYSASKAAVLALAEAMHREVRSRTVHVSVVLPYLAATEAGSGMVPQPGFRACRPDQVATTVARLLRRPRPRAYVPRHLGPLLGAVALLPRAARDLLDDVLRTDRIGMGADAGRRRRYEEQLRDRYDPAGQ